MLTHLITTAVPQAVLATNGAEATGNPLASLLPFLLIGVVFYFLIIRPQKKRQQDQQAMVKSLGVGDRIITIGGFHGEIIGLTEDTMQLEIAPGTVVTMARNAISKSLSDHDPLLDEDPLDDDDLDFDDRSLDDEDSAAVSEDGLTDRDADDR